jgi:hypothetical protein
MLRLTRAFIREWVAEYDRRSDPRDRADEQALKAWLRGQQDPKHLDKTHFVRLARWAAPRRLDAYESNSPVLVRQATRLANQATDERLKMHVLSALDGVSVMVAAAMLHFFHPRLYPIFDIHDRATLKKAGFWPRRVDDGGVDAWQDYVRIMRRLARRFRVSLRDLDKALYAYDRWRPRRPRRQQP